MDLDVETGDPVVKQGPLLKRMRGAGLLSVTRWQRRYFVLTPTALKYYQSKVGSCAITPLCAVAYPLLVIAVCVCVCMCVCVFECLMG